VSSITLHKGFYGALSALTLRGMVKKKGRPPLGGPSEDHAQSTRHGGMVS